MGNATMILSSPSPLVIHQINRYIPQTPNNIHPSSSSRISKKRAKPDTHSFSTDTISSFSHSNTLPSLFLHPTSHLPITNSAHLISNKFSHGTAPSTLFYKITSPIHQSIHLQDQQPSV